MWFSILLAFTVTVKVISPCLQHHLLKSQEYHPWYLLVRKAGAAMLDAGAENVLAAMAAMPCFALPRNVHGMVRRWAVKHRDWMEHEQSRAAVWSEFSEDHNAVMEDQIAAWVSEKIHEKIPASSFNMFGGLIVNYPPHVQQPHYVVHLMFNGQMWQMTTGTNTWRKVEILYKSSEAIVEPTYTVA